MCNFHLTFETTHLPCPALRSAPTARRPECHAGVAALTHRATSRLRLQPPARARRSLTAAAAAATPSCTAAIKCGAASRTKLRSRIHISRVAGADNPSQAAPRRDADIGAAASPVAMPRRIRLSIGRRVGSSCCSGRSASAAGPQHHFGAGFLRRAAPAAGGLVSSNKLNGMCLTVTCTTTGNIWVGAARLTCHVAKTKGTLTAGNVSTPAAIVTRLHTVHCAAVGLWVVHRVMRVVHRE